MGWMCWEKTIGSMASKSVSSGPEDESPQPAAARASPRKGRPVRPSACMTLRDMENLGVILDDEKNNSNPAEGLISADDSPVKIAIVPTNEEFIVVQAVAEKLK
jgi:hypothetical protein